MSTNDANITKEKKWLEGILNIGRKIIPKKLFRAAQPVYHYLLAVLGAIIYRFPAKKMIVIGVTGTKGKTTTVELVNSILEAAGAKTALSSTLHYKIGERDWRNLFKMTSRGRFFTQSFLRQAANEGCTHAVIEMSSEGVPQSRHRFLYPGVVIFTNLAPEHIESHGSYEKYVAAKLTIAKELERRSDGVIVANTDDKEGQKFLDLNIKNKVPYSLKDAFITKSDESGSSFQVGKLVIHSRLPGLFNIYNMLAAVAYAKFTGLPDEKIKEGLEKINFVRGRMEKINAGQPFDVVVDYAHTPDSLTAAYEAYVPRLTKKTIGLLASVQKKNKIKYHLIGILGSTGGGRDRWKREEMGKIADKYCSEIILTNEDPYDEDPMQIIRDVQKGIKKKPVQIILDRREAIREALYRALAISLASFTDGLGDKLPSANDPRVAVLITGKGTDPYIMGPHHTRLAWDDATVAREELRRVMKQES